MGNTIVPLDPRPPVYQAIQDGNDIVCERIRPGTNMLGNPIATMVSHYATCTHAAQFSGSKKKGAPQS